METLGIVSIVALLVAIVLGFLRKTNVGIIAIAMSLLLGRAFGLSDKELISGFSNSLFLTMTGVSYLFGILSTNKTLDVLSTKVVGGIGNKKFMLPIIMFLLGALLCGVGPGAIPTLAIMPVIAVPIAVSSGFHPVMLAIIAQCGVMGARMSPLTPDAAVVMQIMETQGIATNMTSIFLSHIATAMLISLIAFVYYKGWKRNLVEDKELVGAKFTIQQAISIGGLVAMIVLVVVFNINVGLVSFAIGSLLSLIGVADEGKAIKSVPWNVILLVLGVGLLMNIVSLSGGIDIMAKGMSQVMSPRSAPAVMVVSASVMSFFSSGLGVVFPTLMPTATSIAQTLGAGVSAKELIAMVSVGGTFTGLSPISTTGALIMSAIGSDEHVSDKFPQNRLFLELVVWAMFTIIFEAILAYIGFYRIFS